ncbi:DNA topoisomerase III [compost metagenome]
MEKIENNESDAGKFQKQTENYAASIANELLQTPVAKNNLPDLICPKCKSQQLIIRDKIVKCPEETCNWIQFRNVCGAQISIDNIKSLVSNCTTSLIKGMKSRSGKKFDAYIVLNHNAETTFEFATNKSFPSNGK